ncbi:ABC transporter substrate-binding protein [Rhabdothermincola salaria]|uniref:ABC transporter substrate-binding protein n=1 Tax=Rhabdothermincola salaria TaxID=2903142 RepID=UPI001E4059FA|nr:ABC transporter substrate-binding protein [Rhabdothermincola salaria]MCD9624271.1 ABC transporter substrate-binding protein [Rhabdothermincola salaria]
MKRILVVAAAVVMVAAGCGRDGGGEATGPVDPGPTSSSPDDAAADACEGVELEATEIGVTAEEIRIQVTADVGSPLAPGLFQASMDAVEGFAEWVNDNGGIACRDLVVETYDSRLDPAEAKNAQITACANALAMVGGNTLFNPDTVTLDSCADQSGQPTGLPNLAAIANDAAEQCAATTWNISGVNEPCGSPTSGVRTFQVQTAPFEWLNEQHGGTLEGYYLVPQDLPSLIRSGTYLLEAQRAGSIDILGGIKVSGRATQPDFTSVAQRIKESGANYVYNGSEVPAMVMMRKEAEAQGVTGVDVWACISICYSEKFASEGDLVDGTYTILTTLPIEESDDNETLGAYVDHVAEPDGFAANSWMAGVLFKQAIDQIVAEEGPNAITRATLLDAAMSIDDFTADGMMGPKGPKGPQECFVVLQLNGGVFERQYPTEEGTLQCEPIGEVSLDPAVAAEELS